MLRNSCCSKKFVTHLSLGLHINCTLNIPCYVGIIDNVNKVFFLQLNSPSLSIVLLFPLVCFLLQSYHCLAFSICLYLSLCHTSLSASLCKCVFVIPHLSLTPFPLFIYVNDVIFLFVCLYNKHNI